MKYVLAQYNYTNPPQGFGVTDLGTLNWSYSGGNFHAYLTGMQSRAKKDTVMKCPKYTSSNSGSDKTIYNYFRSVYIYDSDYTDAAAFKAAMSGVKLIYELKTNTIPYDNVPCSYFALNHDNNQYLLEVLVK